jgi:two-component system nitrate/nitrite response regulator NarL
VESTATIDLPSPSRPERDGWLQGRSDRIERSPAVLPIRVLIVARVRLYRDGLAETLARNPRIQVVGTAAQATDGLKKVFELRPDVVLADLEMDSGERLVRACVRAVPNAKVLALCVSDSEHELLNAAEVGVSGYVTHDTSLDELVSAVASVARGEMLCSPRVAATLLRQVGALASRARPRREEARLTPRELQILELIDVGRSNKEIARELYIEVPTVKNHVHNILEKLCVGRRAEAAAKLRDRRLLAGPRPPEEQRPGP